MLCPQVLRQLFLRAEGFSFSPSLQLGLFGLQNGCGERVLRTFESHA
jgi:hypothetical protein